MVRKIRFRGHVIRLYGLQPSTSQSEPPSCPTCGFTYDDGKNRKCVYLCCEFEDCFECVINKNMYQCHQFKPKLRRYLVSEDDDNSGEENLCTAMKPESVQITDLSVPTSSDDENISKNVSDTAIKMEYENVQLNLECTLKKFLPEKHRNAVVVLEKIAQQTALSNESQSDLKDERLVVLEAKRRSSRLVRGNVSVTDIMTRNIEHDTH